jgi:transcriptional regulator with XRE-family HTH domain
MESKPPPRLLNLLRAQRKCAAFSQDEIAFLLGVRTGSKVSRYEQMLRAPELETALAFEAISNRPVAELFPGLFEKVKAAVQARARELAKRVFLASSTSLMAQKRKSISGIINKKKRTVTNSEQTGSCVIGLAPSSRGLGYAVMMKGSVLVDWGVKVINPSNKNEQSIAHAGKLLELYGPGVLAFEDSGTNSRRGARIRELILDVEERARTVGVKVERFSRKEISREILQNENATKLDLAQNLATRYPDQLAFRMPKKRRFGDGEAYQIDIFDAVALAQCCCRRTQSRFKRKKRNAEPG